MAQNYDYIPKTDGELLTFAKNLYAYALAHSTRWSVPSPQPMLEADITAFEAALAHALRGYVQGFVARNPAVTGEDHENFEKQVWDYRLDSGNRSGGSGIGGLRHGKQQAGRRQQQ